MLRFVSRFIPRRWLLVALVCALSAPVGGFALFSRPVAICAGAGLAPLHLALAWTPSEAASVPALLPDSPAQFCVALRWPPLLPKQGRLQLKP